MSSGTESSTYRRAAYLEAKRLGTAPPAATVPQPIPKHALTPEFRRAKQLEARRLGLAEPNFGPEFSNKPAWTSAANTPMSAAEIARNLWLSDMPSGFKMKE